MLLLLAGLVGLTPAAAIAAPHQTLAIYLNAENASTERLPHYRAASPIAVHVAGDARKFDTVTVIATGPDGSAIRTPLARTAGGFDGALRLATPGAWQIGLTTQLGSVSNAIANVPLDVVAADGSDEAGYAGFVLAVMLMAAGVFVLVRRPVLVPAPAIVELTKRSSRSR